MTFRITDPAQLETVAPHIRKQLEGQLERVEIDRGRLETRALAADGPAAGAAPAEPAEAKAAPRKRKKRNRQPEQEVGRALVKWIDAIVLPDGTRPGEYFAHVANAGIAQGKVRGGIFHGQGVRPGWPDYILDLPFGGFHGFRLELKPLDGDKPTADQLATLARLERVGYRVAVAWGIDEAVAATSAYLALGGYRP